MNFSTIKPGVALGETSTTAYRGDRGKTAYDHSQLSGNPHATNFLDLFGTVAVGQLPLDVARKSQNNFFLTDQAVTGNITATGNIGTQINTLGVARMSPGTTGVTGYFEWYKPNGTRQGFVGYDAGNDITLTNNVGGNFVINCPLAVTGNITASGSIVANVNIVALGYLETIGKIKTGTILEFALDNSYITTAGGSSIFITSVGSAQPIKVGGLVVSDSYLDTAPTNGIFSKGNITASGTGTFQSTGTHTFGTTNTVTMAAGAISTRSGDTFPATLGLHQLRMQFTAGGFSHWVRTIHNEGSPIGNAMEFLTHNGTTDTLAASVLGLTISNGNISTGNITASGNITSVIHSQSTDLSVADIASGQTRISKNTTTGTSKIWLNDAGTMRSVTFV